MRLNGFDFLTSAPQNFIFQRKSNKTNFGGVLSFIYLLIFLTITSFYLVSYYNEDDYSIQYLYQEKILTNKEKREMINSTRYNPYFNFSLNLTVVQDKKLEDRIKILGTNKFFAPEINKSKSHKLRLKDIDWYIAYECLDDNETQCLNELYMLGYRSIALRLYYNGFTLDHQNKTSPLYRKNGEGISHSLTLIYELFNPTRRYERFNLIRYKEQKGFFSMLENEEDNDYIGLGIQSSDYSEMNSLYGSRDIFVYSLKNDTILTNRIIGRVVFDIDFNHCDEYKRTPKSIWDTLANICSLSMTLLNGLSFTFVNYFSNNFDNYKIMEKIIYNNNFKPIKKDKKNKELNGDLNKNEDLLNKSNEDKDILVINDETNNEEQQDILNGDFNNDNENFPKLNCFDFLFSGIYNGKCCCKLNIKKLIEKSNEIISKYYSIENIIYNQIKFENMLKDYRWNNQELNNFDNNDLVIQFKNLISPFNND